MSNKPTTEEMIYPWNRCQKCGKESWTSTSKLCGLCAFGIYFDPRKTKNLMKTGLEERTIVRIVVK